MVSTLLQDEVGSVDPEATEEGVKKIHNECERYDK